MVYIIVCFFALFFTSMFYGSKANKSPLPDWGRYTVFGSYTVLTILITIWAVKYTVWIHEIKERDGYNFVPSDIVFNKAKDVIKLAIFCAIAAILCGMTGIAGGMVLGPLFLSYNMLPSVMSSTNQYITMIASLSVVIQFFMNSLLSPDYALIFGSLSFVSALTGLVVVNKIIQKSGKQSIIAILLTVVLVVALILLPVNYLLKSK